MKVSRKPPPQDSGPLRGRLRPPDEAREAKSGEPRRGSKSDVGRSAPRARGAARRGREIALQMLYQWEVGRSDIDSVLQTYWQLEAPGSAPADEARVFAEQLARGTAENLAVSDPLIAGEAQHWRLSRLALLDRLILRLAVYELLHADTPSPVVINEAIELAKKFSTEASAKFINGVLDAIRRRVEANEEAHKQ